MTKKMLTSIGIESIRPKAERQEIRTSALRACT